MLVSEFPDFKNPRNNTLEEEALLLAKLLYLQALEYTFSSTYNHVNQDWDSGSYQCLLANDTFSYACADAVEFEEKDVDTILHMHVKFGYEGVLAWMSVHEKCEPIQPLITPKYEQARECLISPTFIIGELPQLEPIAIEDIEFVYKLFWMNSHDITDFLFKKEQSGEYQGIELSNSIVAWSLDRKNFTRDHVEEVVDLVKQFGYKAMIAWEVNGDFEIRKARKDDETPEYFSALNFLKKKYEQITST